MSFIFFFYIDGLLYSDILSNRIIVCGVIIECKYLFLFGVICDAPAHSPSHFVTGGRQSQNQQHDDCPKNTDIRQIKILNLINLWLEVIFPWFALS